MANLFIDADGCPVVDSAIQIASGFQVPVVLICDTAHEMSRPGAETIIVPKGADAVDFTLINRVSKNDLVITQDYGLAAMVLARQARAIDQNGREYTSSNIDQLLHSRHTAKKIRQAGGRLKGPKKRTAEQNSQFEAGLTALFAQLIEK